MEKKINVGVDPSGIAFDQSIFNEDSGAAVERVQGAEILPSGFDCDGLPDGLKSEIENAIYDFMTFECKPPIEDMSKARAPRWSACCMYIGQTVCKKYLRPKGERDKCGKWLPLDEKLIDALLPVWAFFCQIFDKIPLETDFFYFCGFNFGWIYGGDLTSERNKIKLRLNKMQEVGLSTFISDGTRNPAGALAILNHFHGWSRETIVVHNVNVSAISADDLPKLPQK